VKKYIFILASLFLLSACGGSSSGSGSGGAVLPSYGDVSVGQAGILSAKAGSTRPSIMAIPLYNTSSKSVVLGASVSSSNTDVTFTMGSCANSTLAPGEYCTVSAIYTAADSFSPMQTASFQVAIAQSANNESVLSGIINYETLESSYSKAFIAQSAYPITTQDSNKTYTSLWLYNAGSSNMLFDNKEITTTLTSGSGILINVESDCDFTNGLESNTGCYVILSYSNVSSSSSHVTAKDTSNASSFRVTANPYVYLDLTVQSGSSSATDASSVINLSTYTMVKGKVTVPIVNSGNLPITAISASVNNSSFSVDYSDCTNELAITPGSDTCDIIVTKTESSATGGLELTVTYSDTNGDRSVAGIINYGNVMLLPASITWSSSVGESNSQVITIINMGTESASYNGYTKTNLGSGFSVDDSGCSGKTLSALGGLCKVTLSYTPTTATKLSSGSVNFNILTNISTESSTSTTISTAVSYQAQLVVPVLSFYDSLGGHSINTISISSKVGESAQTIVYLKNTGDATASSILGSLDTTVNGLSSSGTVNSTLAPSAGESITFTYSPTSVESDNTIYNVKYQGNDGAEYSTNIKIVYSSSITSAANLSYCNDGNCSTTRSSIALSNYVGATSTSNVWLKNNGNAPATNIISTLTNSNAGVTIESTSCGATLAANSTPCQISVKYAPTAVANATLNLNTSYNKTQGSESIVTLKVNYTATVQPVPALTYCSDANCTTTLSSLAITTTEGTAKSSTVYVKNTGTAATGALSSSTFAGSSHLSVTSSTCAAGLAAAATCNVVFSYSPTVAESGSATYTLTTNTGDLPFNLPINYKATSNTAPSVSVNGWPSYLAMGGVTNNDPAEYTGRQTDAIFRYSNGDGAATLEPPYGVWLLITEAATIKSAQNNQNVVPTMVVYTNEQSTGLNTTSMTVANMSQHFTNLINNVRMMESASIAASSITGGSFVINPDTLGEIQKDGATATGQVYSDATYFPVTASLNRALCGATNKFDWSGVSLGPTQPVDSFNAFVSIAKSSSAYNALEQWNANFTNIVWNNCTTTTTLTAGINVPTFTDDFRGWIQATNWIFKQFGPNNVTFGWQENVWTPGTSTWVHNTSLTTATIQSNEAVPVSTWLNSVGVFNGTYKPDFIVFDKYERDGYNLDARTFSIGYLWNQFAFSSYLTYINKIATDVGGANYPIMIWQLPGGHLQYTTEPTESQAFASTEPDWVFGDSTLSTNFANVNPVLLGTSGTTYASLDSDYYISYGGQTPLAYFGDVAAWQTSHLQDIANANVFAILWGGGNTTSIGSFPNRDNWLSNKVNTYYSNTQALK